MRLTELSPKWVGINDQGRTAHIGIGFQCPHCREQRLVVFFRPYIDPDNIVPLNMWRLPDAPNPNTGTIAPVNWWNRIGETYESLTLSPSVDVGAAGHWHGHIQDGEVK